MLVILKYKILNTRAFVVVPPMLCIEKHVLVLFYFRLTIRSSHTPIYFVSVDCVQLVYKSYAKVLGIAWEGLASDIYSLLPLGTSDH